MQKYDDEDEVKSSDDSDDSEPMDIDNKLEEVGLHPGVGSVETPDLQEESEETKPEI